MTPGPLAVRRRLPAFATIALATLSANGVAQCELARLVAGDAMDGDQLGNAAALSGGTGLLGAAAAGDLGSRSGAVYVVEDGAAGWIVGDKLLASDGTAHRNFGTSVAIEGDRALVGAPGGNGAVYAYERTPSGWVEVQKLVAGDLANGGAFGKSLSLAGDRVVIGAESNDSIVDSEGAAYVFERDAAGWAQVAKLVPPDGRAYDYFGSAVGLSGDTIAVGARGHEIHGFANKGAVYVFERDASGWNFAQKLTIYEGNDNDQLGTTLALRGERLLAGATGTLGPAGSGGAAYLFERTASGWVREQSLYAESPFATSFGGAVALSGDKVLVSAASAGEEDFRPGRVFVYRRSPSEWLLEYEFVGTVAVSRASFGRSLAASGDTLLVGATGAGDLCDGPYECDSGAAYVFSVPVGSTRHFCDGTPNSSGAPAVLALEGCAQVAANALRLSASPVPQGKPGIFFYGDRALAPAPFGDGLRCAGGRVFRLPLVHANGTVMSFALDLTSPPQAAGQIHAGSTWYFQAYYRDTAAGGAGFNLSDALEVQFQ